MASSENDAVRKVMQNYMNGTYQGDVKALRECFHPNAVMNGYLGDQLLLGGPEPFFENIEHNPPMAQGGVPYKGEITFVDVSGRVACATLKERGFAGTMNFTNYFHLVKAAGEWKILSKTFTTEG